MSRLEKDFIGEMEVPDAALYGIHSLRAKNNFPDTTLFHKEWYQALGLVKLACYNTYNNYRSNLLKKYHENQIPFKLIDINKMDALIHAAKEISQGEHYGEFIVPAISGGAGTSINMNVNEILSNVALQKSQKSLGDYQYIDPIETANIYQSTNDVIPTALKIAAIQLLEKLQQKIDQLRQQTEILEKKHQNHLRMAYTQMQEAVPSSFGKLLSTYNDALSRDWWRVSKCFERIKVVNLGGSAVGTGLTIPRYFIIEVVNEVQKLTNLPISRSENLSDNTCNLDAFVEIHAIIKAHAVNLEKLVSDLRLLSSSLVFEKEISIPQKQVGSSIMPGKTNPVIPEFVISISHKIYANDQLISSLCGQGCLDLNAYLPIIGHTLLESIKLLIAADTSIFENLICNLTINHEIALQKLFRSPSITTALLPFIGYHKSNELAKWMKSNSKDIFAANEHFQFLTKDLLEKCLSPEMLLKLGFTMEDIIY